MESREEKIALWAGVVGCGEGKVQLDLGYILNIELVRLFDKS